MSWSSLHASQHCSHTSDSVHHWHWSTPCVSDEGSLDCNLILCFNQNCCSNFHWTFPDPQQFSFSRNSGNETSNRLQGYTFQFDNLQFSQLQIANFEFTIFINCQNPNSTTSKPQPNCSWRLDTKMTVQTTPLPHPTETQCQQYLNCYWPDFDQTLKVDSWDHFELIPTVMATLVQAIFVLATFVHIRNISVVTDPILTKF